LLLINKLYTTELSPAYGNQTAPYVRQHTLAIILQERDVASDIAKYNIYFTFLCVPAHRASPVESRWWNYQYKTQWFG